MGNSQNRYAVTRTAHCPAMVAKSKTTDNMQTNSSEGITTGHAHHKTISCFNFSNCSEQQQQQQGSHFEYRKSLLKQVEGSSPAKKPMLRARPASNNNLFSKVRERLIKLNRRSTPVNFGPVECLDVEESHGLLAAFANSNTTTTAATVVTRSLTDYNLIQFSHNDDNNEPHKQEPRFGKFTKSPALYDIKQYANQNPQHKISDLLEEEKEICYDDYEETNSYNEESSTSPTSSRDTDESSTQSIDQNQTTCSLHSTIRPTRPSNFLQNLSSLNAPTSLSSPPLSTPPPPPDQTLVQPMDVDDLSFIDDGQSECVTLSSSKSSSMPSILFSSFRCSLNNLSRLIAINGGNRCADQSSSSHTSSSHLTCSHTGGSRKKLKLDTQSSTFMQQVNQKLLTHARQGKGAREKRVRLQRLVAATKSKHSDSCVDLQDAQYNNDNISIFNYIQRAPLASSETTTLSSSTDNLLNVKQYSQISGNKYPLINKLLSDHLYQSDHNNNYF